MADPLAEVGVTIHSNRKLPLLMDFPLRPGKVTIFRLSETTGEYTMLIGRGEVIGAPKSFSGTSGRIRFEEPAQEILEFLLSKGLEHHISITYGDHTAELSAFAKMLKIPILNLN